MNQEIKLLTKKLLSDFPQFVEAMSPEDMQPFILFGDFGIYIRDGISNGTLTKNEIAKAFNFLNKIGESTNEEVHNLLTIGVLEVIADETSALKVAMDLLKGPALKDLMLIIRYWEKDGQM